MENIEARIELILSAIAESVEDFGDYELASLNTTDAHWLIDKVRESQVEVELLKEVMRKYDKYANLSYAKKYGIKL